jgi:hypothetical protein
MCRSDCSTPRSAARASSRGSVRRRPRNRRLCPSWPRRRAKPRRPPPRGRRISRPTSSGSGNGCPARRPRWPTGVHSRPLPRSLGSPATNSNSRACTTAWLPRSSPTRSAVRFGIRARRTPAPRRATSRRCRRWWTAGARRGGSPSFHSTSCSSPTTRRAIRTTPRWATAGPNSASSRSRRPPCPGSAWPWRSISASRATSTRATSRMSASGSRAGRSQRLTDAAARPPARSSARAAWKTARSPSSSTTRTAGSCSDERRASRPSSRRMVPSWAGSRSPARTGNSNGPRRRSTARGFSFGATRSPEPVAVRYAFTHNPEGVLLYNKDGLPASPFRTDDW